LIMYWEDLYVCLAQQADEEVSLSSEKLFPGMWAE
jgi:hypothetical protein